MLSSKGDGRSAVSISLPLGDLLDRRRINGKGSWMVVTTAVAAVAITVDGGVGGGGCPSLEGNMAG